MFSAALSIATGTLCGLVPAVDALRANLHDSLAASGRGASGGSGHARGRRVLTVVQVGLAVTLLIGAGLLIRSFGALTRARIGFDPDRVLTAELRAAGERYESPAAVNRFYDAVLGQIERDPGVVAVGAVSS